MTAADIWFDFIETHGLLHKIDTYDLAGTSGLLFWAAALLRIVFTETGFDPEHSRTLRF